MVENRQPERHLINLGISFNAKNVDILRKKLSQIGAKKNVIVFTQSPISLSPLALYKKFPKSFICDSRTFSPARFNRTSKAPPHTSRVLCITSNGTGLGHVSRLIAIANSMPQDTDIQFLSFSGATHIIEDAGFEAHHVASPEYLGLGQSAGYLYVKERVLQSFAVWMPDIVVFDGNIVYPGLFGALSLYPECPLVWVRRGMWRKTLKPKYMAQQALVDLVVEPGDIAQDYDVGESWNGRQNYCEAGAFLRTAPVTWQPQRLKRKNACEALGLSPNEKYILVQLGSGNLISNKDMLDILAKTLAKHTVYTPVIAHWPIAHNAPNPPKGWISIEKTPLSSCYSAFEACVSAAGYNSYHELLEQHIPTLFIPQTDPRYEHQDLRAQYAADNGFALIALPPYDDLATQISKLCSKEAQESLSRSCADIINQHNGADEIATLIRENARRTEPQDHHKSMMGIDKSIEFVSQQLGLEAVHVAGESDLAGLSHDKHLIVTDAISPLMLRREGWKYFYAKSP